MVATHKPEHEIVNCDLVDDKLKNEINTELEKSGRHNFDWAADENELALVNGQDNKANNDNKKPMFLFGFRDLVWTNIVWLTILHVIFVWAFIYTLLEPIKFFTVVWGGLLSVGTALGLSVGNHRLWAHRTFQAKPLLRFFLLCLQTATMNGSVISFARDHRNHHKWSGTHADPKNPDRGFFYAHIGWWLLRKRPEVIEYGKKIPIDDMLEEKMLVFQHRYYLPLMFLSAFIIPVGVPILIWNEHPFISLGSSVIRILLVLHHFFAINSFAHFYGHHPYNRYQKPTENQIINWISMGEGHHNYHHTFPFDYCNSEFYWWEKYSPASLFIEVCILLRLASKPKKPSKALIRKVGEAKGKPEYFAMIDKRSLPKRIAIGLFDWLAGMFVTQWPLWIGLVFKVIDGRPTIVF
ncbi:hypothetical protein RDWZM_005533 [Blomia tropicalis]|uniref:Fatty acid desaturase domain-containing protein n=1 Tax=Blomia tropicalis TaxID=40697 RepID=A0A9Q0M5E8_BLOTA|nr:hypothetical protein RDWZM_005533 [Blomia tropicalis]